MQTDLSLKSGAAMAIGAVTFTLLQILWSLGHAYGGWRGALVLGAMGAMAVALLVVGPGNLWPLVLVLDGIVMGCAALLGAVIGMALGKSGSS